MFAPIGILKGHSHAACLFFLILLPVVAVCALHSFDTIIAGSY